MEPSDSPNRDPDGDDGHTGPIPTSMPRRKEARTEPMLQKQAEPEDADEEDTGALDVSTGGLETSAGAMTSDAPQPSRSPKTVGWQSPADEQDPSPGSEPSRPASQGEALADIPWPLADKAQRCRAALIDYGGISALVIVCSLVYLIIGFIPLLGWLVQFVVTLILLLGIPGFLLVRDGLYDGRSPGKKWVGLRVVTASGERCGWTDSVKRNLTMAIPFVAMAELAFLYTSEDARRLGDQFAETRVVVDGCDLEWTDIAPDVGWVKDLVGRWVKRS